MSIERTTNTSKNIANMPGGKTSLYLKGIQEQVDSSNKTRIAAGWKDVRQINKVSPEDKRVDFVNSEAQPGEQIFRQTFYLQPETGLSREYHEGMEEIIAAPSDESWRGPVKISMFHPVTKKQEIVILQRPSDKAIIPPYTIHSTTNLSPDRVALIAEGTRINVSGNTVKEGDIKEEEIFNPNRVAVCIATKYDGWTPGPVDLSNEVRTRGYLANGLISEAAHHGYKVVISDGGSSKAFLDELKSHTNVTVITEKSTFGKQKKAAIETASSMEGVEWIFRIEPEKVDSIKHIPLLVEPIVQGKADITIGKRRDSEFKSSYPDYCYNLENETNQLMNQHLRDNNLLPQNQPNLDLYSGLIAFRNTPEIVSLFTTRYQYIGEDNINPMVLEGWMNAHVYGVILGLHNKFQVQEVEVPFWYARLQQLNELHPERIESFKNKRTSQQLIGDLGVKLLAETLSGKQTHLAKE